MKCLRERTTSDLPDSLTVTLHNPHICIAHLNIQGLKSKELCKSEDISIDDQMQKVDVMGSMVLNVHLMILALVTAKRYTGMTGVGKVVVPPVQRKFKLKLLAYKLTNYAK